MALKNEEQQSLDSRTIDVPVSSSYPTSRFHVTSQGTVESFEQNAPWVLAERRDPYVDFQSVPFNNMTAFNKVDGNILVILNPSSIGFKKFTNFRSLEIF